MTLRKPLIAASALIAGAFLAVAAPLSASAHVDVTPDDTAAGSYTVLTFSLPHGCEASPTTAISIGIPKNVASVTPTVNPDWTVSKVPVDLAKPIDDGEGNTITTRTGEVVYTAHAPFADGLRTTFALSLQLPADAEGETLEFPVVQTCETGETLWNEPTVEGEEEPEHPAPSVTVTEASDEGHGHGGATASAAGHDEAAAPGAPAPADDVLARGLGIGGLAVGAVGVVLAVTARRKPSA